nr:zinc finger, CCHC-type [Tanacetum cinerariifolium]
MFRLNIVNDNIASAFMSTSKLNDSIIWHARLGHVYFKRIQDMSKDRVPNRRNKITPYELWTEKKPNLNYLRVWGCGAVVRLPDLKLKTLGERGIKCIFVGYDEHSKTFRFYVIEPNNSVSINSIIELMDAIFDENRFSLVPGPSLRIPNGTKDIGGSMVPEELTKEACCSHLDKLTSGDKSLDLSAFKLSRLFFSFLSSGSLVVGDRIGFSESIVTNQ